jgi:ketosteroid isomerase-like protein
MKADQKTQDEVTLTLRGMFEAYAKRDLNGVLAFWASDPDVAMIGSGADERSVGINQFAKIIMRDWSQSDSAKVNVKEIVVSSAGTIAWFSTDVVFNVKSGVDQIEFSGRLTGVMEKRGDLWLLVQMHFSVPSNAQATGQSWPEPQPTT